MKRITNIKFRNYRAFYGEYELKIPKGENLLIYGENGSGKTALLDAFALPILEYKTENFSIDNFNDIKQKAAT